MKTNEMNSVNETKVVCPVCGAEFAIADKTHVATGVVIGKDAGLGTIHPEVVGQSLPSKAADRIEALRAAGVDVSGFFAMTGANGGESVAAMKDGMLTIVTDDDPIYDCIIKGGDVYNAKLARRWVMAQMFHMLARETYSRWGSRERSATDQIRAKGYDYMWRQMEDELYAQYKMAKNGDAENFADRNRWFNKDVVLAMLDDYRYQLHLHVKRLAVHKCKGVPYKNVCGENVFVSDIEHKVFAPIYKMMDKVRKCDKPYLLWVYVQQFNRTLRKQRGWNPKQCLEWIDSYKGAGAFFTMQNMIRYHRCHIAGMNKQASYKALVGKAEEYKYEGWRLLGMLRKFLEDNGIDINAKMAEWSKRK